MEAVPDGSVPYGTQYQWNFGSGASPSSATGPGPHTIQYTTSGSKTVTCTATHNSVVTIETTNITVSSCPGNIIGTIKRQSDGTGLVNYNMKLYEDFDEDGLPDGAAIRSVFSNGSGGWSMATLYPGTYILEQANGATVSTVSIIDQGNLDGIVDPLDPVDPIANPANTAVSIIVRISQTQGSINIIMNN